jgi:hypothetical protein
MSNGLERQQLWPDLRYQTGMCLGGLKKYTKTPVRAGSLRNEISTQMLLNTKECHPLCRDVR